MVAFTSDRGRAVVVTGRPLLAASVSGAPAWILWQVSRDALQLRIRQLERDPYVNPQVVRDLRATAAGLEEAARQYRELVDRSRSEVADSVEVPQGGPGAGLGVFLIGGLIPVWWPPSWAVRSVGLPSCV